MGLSWVNLLSKDFYLQSIPRSFQQIEIMCVYTYGSTLLALKKIMYDNDDAYITMMCNSRGGGRVMPYVCHTETCRRSGYTFWPSNPRQGVFFDSDSKTGCQICTITPSQGAYSQYSLAPSRWF